MDERPRQRFFDDDENLPPAEAANQIAARMFRRNADVVALKAHGCLGEDNRGHLSLRPAACLADHEHKNSVQRAMAAENADRKSLYREIAKAYTASHLNVSAIEHVHAAQRRATAGRGEAFQLPQAGPEYDAFLASPLGQALGPKCEPKAWVIFN
ncbi:MAG: DUF1318 domain-containing protein [Candidatus Aminicenantes bacterium]|nr:MAG: DUF1318 domain-containing protein [Candidatus Aminicenantes bacterium]